MMPRALRRNRLQVAMFASLAVAGMGLVARAQDAKTADSVFDLSRVPGDAPVVISLRPAALLKISGLKTLYEEATRSDEAKRAVAIAEPETIEQITFALLSRDIPVGHNADEAIARAGAVIVKTNKPREWKALAAAGGVPLTRNTHDGKDYFTIEGNEAMGYGFYQPNETTLIVATATNLQKIMTAGNPSERLSSLLKQHMAGTKPEAGTPVMMATLDFAWLRGLLSPALKSEPEAALGLSVVGPIFEKTNEVVMSLTATDDELSLTVDHLCGDAEGAKSVAKTVEALLTLAQNAAPEALRIFREQARGEPVAADLANMGEQVVKTASVSTIEGQTVRLKTTVKADMAKLVRAMMNAH